MTTPENSMNSTIREVSDRSRHYVRCQTECREHCKMQDILDQLGVLATARQSAPHLEEAAEYLDGTLAESCVKYRLAQLAIE